MIAFSLTLVRHIALKANRTEMVDLANQLEAIQTQLSEIMTMLEGKVDLAS